MGWLYLVLGVLAILIAYTTLYAWLLGVFTAVAVIGVIIVQFFRNFSSPKGMTEVIEPILERGKFSLRERRNAVDEFLKRYHPSRSVHSFSLAVTFLLLVLMLKHPGLIKASFLTEDDNQTPVILGFIVAPIIVALFISWIKPNENLQKFARMLLRRKLESINIASAGIKNVEEISSQIRDLADALEIDHPPLPTDEAISKISSQVIEVIQTPALAESILADCIELGKCDLDGLKSSAALFEEVMEKHRKSRSSIFGTRSRSFIDSLDQILEKLCAAKAKLLPERDWKKFAKIVENLLAQLDQLAIDATTPIAPDGEATSSSSRWRWDPWDPYEILGVAKDARLGHIQKVYWALCAIYSEKGSSPDSEKNKMINRAWNDIEDERRNIS